MSGELLATLVFAALALLTLKKTAVVVPQQSAYVVERLGKYSSTLNAGLHILVPFIDVIRYKHSLKELALDVPEQICITKDNVQVGVDGVLYIKVLDAERASYGITDYPIRDFPTGPNYACEAKLGKLIWTALSRNDRRLMFPWSMN